jgi:hypothetical protein
MQNSKQICPKKQVALDDDFWTAEEDKYLKELVVLYGTRNWSIVVLNLKKKFPYRGKTEKQCLKRWQNLIDPLFTNAPWNDKEDAQLLLAHMKFKNKWTKISTLIEGRSNNVIKNHFYSVFRKVKNKVISLDVSWINQLELIQVRYILDLINHYLSNPLPPSEKSGRRGKDYIYTLMENVTKKNVTEFEARLKRSTTLQGDYEELLKACCENGDLRSAVSQSTITPKNAFTNMEIHYPKRTLPMPMFFKRERFPVEEKKAFHALFFPEKPSSPLTSASATYTLPLPFGLQKLAGSENMTLSPPEFQEVIVSQLYVPKKESFSQFAGQLFALQAGQTGASISSVSPPTSPFFPLYNS